MNKVTQTNAANAEESASAAEELNAQATMLRDAVRELDSFIGLAGTDHGRATDRLAASTTGFQPQSGMRSQPRNNILHQREAAQPRPDTGTGTQQ